MNKIVCYTCITGGYDSLHDPEIVSDGIDYICFSDHQLESNVWQFRPIPDELKFLSNVKQQRIIKICPHRYLSEYEISIWIDGNIFPIGDISKFVADYDLSVSPLYTRAHPSRKCVYDEAQACIRAHKDTAYNVTKQINRYRAEGYPEKSGMVETCILLRKHNDSLCMQVCNYWAAELMLESHRDQLSFNYVCWKLNFLPGILFKQARLLNNDYFRIRLGHG